MRIPLIVQARPSVGTVYPSVILPPGKWTFTGSTAQELRIVLASSEVGLGETVTLSSHSPVSVKVIGNVAESTTIYACRSH